MGGATTFASAKVKNAIGRIGIFTNTFIRLLRLGSAELAVQDAWQHLVGAVVYLVFLGLDSWGTLQLSSP